MLYLYFEGRALIPNHLKFLSEIKSNQICVTYSLPQVVCVWYISLQNSRQWTFQSTDFHSTPVIILS